MVTREARTLSRDVEVAAIPYGDRITLTTGTTLFITQALGGSYTAMTDKQAASLAGKVFDWEKKRTQLKRAWFKKFSKVVPAKKAAQFFQIENQLNAVLDLRLAAALPLIK